MRVALYGCCKLQAKRVFDQSTVLVDLRCKGTEKKVRVRGSESKSESVETRMGQKVWCEHCSHHPWHG